VAWLTLGIASVALALIAALVLRSERESTAILHHLNLVALHLQEVLSDLADAEAEQRGYLLTSRPTSLKNFQRSRQALGLEFDRLATLVKKNPAERQEVERVRYLIQQDLDELERSIASHTAAFAEILTDRARKLTEALRQSIYGIDKEDERALARLARQRRTRLARALGAVSGALLLAASYVLMGQIMIARGASRHQKTEAALRASENRFETLCEQAPVGIYSTDAQGHCVYTNSRWCQMSGLSAAESLGNGWKEALHPDDRETVFEAWKTYALQGTSWEYRLLNPEGEIRWIRALGGPIYSTGGEITGYIGTVEDITEQKHAYEELQRQRERSAEARGMERFRLSFDEAPVGMALIRGDGVWLHVNRALCEMTGYTESELISQDGEITHLDDREEESLLLARILSGELVAGRLEERYRHKQGHTIYVLLSIAAVERDEAGRPVHFVAHVQDLTERKRVERELEASRAQMVSSSRLSALGMMAGGIAHEINNPLAVIHASAANINRMVESGSVEVSGLLKNSNRISQTADRISRIVRSLCHVARESSADEFRETRVRDIVDETLELCAERFRAHNTRLVVSAVDPDLKISSREAQICQVLLNLLQNAFDELVDLKGDRWVKLEVAVCPGWVVFSVSDSGPGIAPEHRAHIMEPFFTTKPAGKGIGLGLSISRSIALEHGGTLELDQESTYTCFRLKLPTSERT
jgi:PAS domain S-box-containing protein